jgi:hypothetical protein
VAAISSWRGATRFSRYPTHNTGDIGVGLLASILRQAGVARTDWEDA